MPKKPKNKHWPKISLGPFLAVLSIAIYLGSVWFYVNQSYQNSPLPSSKLTSSQTYTSPDYAKSLDLRVAGKATYPSETIKNYKNIRSSDGITESEISFRADRDNLTEYALMMLPNGQTPSGGFPVLILCHSYYNPDQYLTESGFLNDMEAYAKAGYAVIKPDYRGQGLSHDQGTPQGAYYSMAYNTDVMSLISAAQDTAYLDKNNINLWGQSMGSYIALRATVLSPAVKHLILLSGPVGTVQDMYTDYMATSDQDNPVALRLRQAMLLKYGNPLNDPQYWNTTSPLNYLSQLKAKVQINVGLKDKVVPPKFSADLDSALTAAGKAHQYFTYAQGDHSLSAERALIWQRSIDFLNSK